MTEEARFLEMVASLPFLALAIVVTGLHLGYIIYAIVADTVAWFRHMHRDAMQWKRAEMERRYGARCRHLNNQQMPKARLIKKQRRPHERPHRYGNAQGTSPPRRRGNNWTFLYP